MLSAICRQSMVRLNVTNMSEEQLDARVHRQSVLVDSMPVDLLETVGKPLNLRLRA